ncbi:MAG: TolB family protein [Phycisphaerales bacterium]
MLTLTGAILLTVGCSETRQAFNNVGQEIGVIQPTRVNDPAVTITPGSNTPAPGTATETGVTRFSESGSVQSPNHQSVYQSVAASITPHSTSTEPAFIGSPTAADGDRPARFVSNMNLYGELPGSPSNLPNDSFANTRQITFTPEGADFDVTVSPDGQTLFFASTQHRPTADIYTKSVTGNTVTQLTSDPANDTMPAISPDGKRLAFCSDRAGSWDIFVLDLATSGGGGGGQPVQLTSSPTQELHPSWSPDGRQIVFCSLGEQSGQWEIAAIDVDNPAQRRFLGYGLFPSFSPDGGKIAFQRARYRGTRWFSIWTLDYNKGEATRPTEIAASANAACINPTWSPDGRELAFVTVMNPTGQTAASTSGSGGGGRPVSGELWVINVDGTGRRQLTTDKFVNLQPAWSRDGFVYFVSNRSGNDNLWAVRSATTPRTQMADQGKTQDNAATATVPTE